MQEFPRTLKIATVWLLVGAAVFLGFQALERQRQQTRFQFSKEKIEIRRGLDGHYHWPGRINGMQTDFLIDTGASSTTISQRIARRLNLKPVGHVQGRTAGGIVSGDLVLADIDLQGGLRIERLPLNAFSTMDDRPLLGMDVLGKLRWQQHDGVLVIQSVPSDSTAPDPLTPDITPAPEPR